GPPRSGAARRRAARGAEAPAGRSRAPISAVTRTVVVVGAGMGGLPAALRLARAGFRVRVLEARAEPGGLASGFVADGLPFDAGPYILLDRPGLEWAFRALGLELGEYAELRRIEEVYEVAGADGTRIAFQADLERTAEAFETRWPGSGTRYATFVAAAGRVYRRLEPLLHRSRPSAADVLRTGAWRHLRFLLSSLGAVLARAGLPPPLVDAIAIWTHVARQRIDEAPSPMAFVPALIHGVGAFYPRAGDAGVDRSDAPRTTPAVARCVRVPGGEGLAPTALPPLPAARRRGAVPPAHRPRRHRHDVGARRLVAGAAPLAHGPRAGRAGRPGGTAGVPRARARRALVARARRGVPGPRDAHSQRVGRRVPPPP